MMREVLGNLADVLSGNTVLNYIADTCVTVSITILFLLLIRPFMKKLPRIGMYVLWFTVLLRMLCPFTIHGIYGIVPQRMEQAAARMGSGWKLENVAARHNAHIDEEQYGGFDRGFRLPAKDVSGGTEVQTERKREAGQMQTVTEDETGRIVSLGSETETTGAKAGKTRKETGEMKKKADLWETLSKVRMATWLLLIWGAGVSVCLAYVLISMFRTKWRFRDAVHVSGNVYTHPLVCGSFVAGFLPPRIYISEQLEEEEQEYILRHEQVHIRRRDYWVKPLVFSVFSLLWFNPLVWVAYHLMMRDMEVSCDESVIRHLPVRERKRYSYLLLAMAGGTELPGHSPAFSVGEVKERIVNVMKYRKPTGLVTALTVTAVVLCSCGVASAPEETVQTVPGQKEVYVEQEMEMRASNFREKWTYKKWEAGYYSEPLTEYVMDPQGRFVWFETLYTDAENKEERKISYAKCSPDQEPQEVAWIKEYEKRFPGGRFWIERYKYGADGHLYLHVMEYSSDKKTYWAEYWAKKESSIEVLHNYLLRVDEETGEMTEIPLPEEKILQTDGSNTAKGIIPGAARLEFAVASDGNLLLTTVGDQAGGLYSGTTGEKLADVTMTGRISDLYAGDDFWVYASQNQTSGKLDVNVLDEDGDLKYTIPTEVEYDTSKYLHMALGTDENTILMACGEGIYEADLDEKEFRYIAGYKTDNIFYLWPDYYGMTMNSIYKGNEEDYYVGMITVYDDDEGWAPGEGPGLWENEQVFHYMKLEDLEIEEE